MGGLIMNIYKDNRELSLFENGTPEKADELKIWREDTWFLDWCKIVPKLSDENLNIYAQFKKIVALGYLIQQKYRNDIRNMLP